MMSQDHKPTNEVSTDTCISDTCKHRKEIDLQPGNVVTNHSTNRDNSHKPFDGIVADMSGNGTDTTVMDSTNVKGNIDTAVKIELMENTNLQSEVVIKNSIQDLCKISQQDLTEVKDLDVEICQKTLPEMSNNEIVEGSIISPKTSVKDLDVEICQKTLPEMSNNEIVEGSIISPKTSITDLDGELCLKDPKESMFVEVEIQDKVAETKSMTYRQTDAQTKSMTYRQTDAEDSGDSMDSDSDDSSSSDTSEVSSKSIASDEEKNTNIKKTGVPNKDINIPKTKGEVRPEDLPALEELKITADEDVVMVQVGTVTSLVGVLAIVESHADVPPLDDNTVLFLENRKAIGQVFEVFGPVYAPWYSVRFNSTEMMREMGVTVGLPVYCAPKEEQYTNYVFVTHLKQIRGSDASWENDNEPPIQHLDFSDDEEERRLKAKQRNKVDESMEGEEMQTRTRNKRARRNANRKKKRGGALQTQAQQQQGQSGRQPDLCYTGADQASTQQHGHTSRGGFHVNTAPNLFQLGHQHSNQFSKQPLTQWPPADTRKSVNRTGQHTGTPDGFNNPQQYLSPPRFQFRGHSGPLHLMNRPPLRPPLGDEMHHNMQNQEWNNSRNSFNFKNMNFRSPRCPAESMSAPGVHIFSRDNSVNAHTGPMHNSSSQFPEQNLFPSRCIPRMPNAVMDNRLVQNTSMDEFLQQGFVNPTFGGQPRFSTRTIRPGPRQFFHRGQHY